MWDIDLIMLKLVAALFILNCVFGLVVVSWVRGYVYARGEVVRVLAERRRGRSGKRG